MAEKFAAMEGRSTLGEIAGAFLRLGCIAFGGPAAHIALMEEEFVRRRGWVTRERFLDLVGAVNLLPGPNSTELAIYLGEIRGGVPGLITAGVAFILPAALLTTALAWAYVQYGAVPQVAGVLYGVKPVVVAILAQAVWALGRTALKSKELWVLAALVAGLTLAHVSTLALLLGTGVAWMAAQRGEKNRAMAGMLGGATTQTAVAAVGMPAVFFYFLKVGAVLFGSGYVLLAFLHADLVVRLHWVTDGQLLDAVAVSQATPGPLSVVATFIGFELGRWKGAALGTAGMFLPAFLFVTATAGFLPKLRQSAAAGAFLDGVNAAAVALMAVVGWQFGRAALLSIPAAILAGVSAVLVFRYRVNSAWLILGGAVAGMIFSFAGAR